MVLIKVHVNQGWFVLVFALALVFAFVFVFAFVLTFTS